MILASVCIANSTQEVNAKEIGNKNEAAKQRCVAVAGGDVPNGRDYRTGDQTFKNAKNIDVTVNDGLTYGKVGTTTSPTRTLTRYTVGEVNGVQISCYRSD